MADKSAREAKVKAVVYVTRERTSPVNHHHLALVVDGQESLIITKSNAQDLADQLKGALKAVGL